MNITDMFVLRDKAAALINLLIHTHPAGFRVLIGDCPPPGMEEVARMLKDYVDREVDLPDQIYMIETEESFCEVVQAIGGWPHIVEVCREWARYHESTWNILLDHSRWVTAGFSRIDNSSLEKVACRHAVSADPIQRRVKEFPRWLAWTIVQTPINNELRLLCG